MVTKRGTRNIASILRFPDRHPEPSPAPRGGKNNRRFAAAMAQVRRPVPFRTRKLRPGTAMVLHPRGCGRVARRRIHRQGPPVEHHAPGGPRISAPTPPVHHPTNTTGLWDRNPRQSRRRTEPGVLRPPPATKRHSPMPLTHEHRRVYVGDYAMLSWIDEPNRQVTVARVVYARRDLASCTG